MEYKNIVEGRFVERPNRFIARVEIKVRKRANRMAVPDGLRRSMLRRFM